MSISKKNIFKQIQEIKTQAEQQTDQIKNQSDLERFKFEFLTRKSRVNQIMRSLKDLKSQDRKAAGQAANQLKNFLQKKYKQLGKQISFDKNLHIDITAPGCYYQMGHLHLTTQAIREIMKIFEKIGFYRVRYPEVEWDWYAFGALNFPEEHPARDEWETFFIDEQSVHPKLGKRILTPHTSSGQVREMQSGRLPIRMMNISKCPRRQLDVSHLLIHHQFEGLVVDKGINLKHLKGVINYFVKQYFGQARDFRIRPYDFLFTEPSFEVDVSCAACNKRGCKLCKQGWLEIGGCGMVHPKVLKNGGIDPSQYTGFAFGWGVERNKIMQEGINIKDIRLLYQNDLNFLEQF
ncbi:MAG: phenylalanine--tRNA ligase subunit alpha [Candidatus Moranbacteria bacterium]|nr:phenylalanine--tRNA ligase subunit alpha [Candidatus Moranbacteria bacterium]